MVGHRPACRTIPGDWADEAACKGRTAVFFPTAAGTNSETVDDSVWDAAKRICATCPVLEPCRDFALRTGEKVGVWGGLDPTERRRIVAALGR